MSSCEVHASVQGTTCVVAVSGEIDLFSVGRLQCAIDQALAGRPETVLLDLSAVEFCDSSGINLVVAAHRQAAEARVGFLVVRPAGPAWRAFEICNIDRYVKFVADGNGHTPTAAAAELSPGS
jgi:anti-sigma B factor antagonist